MYIIFCHFSR